MINTQNTCWTPSFQFSQSKQRGNTNQLYDSQSPKDKNNSVLERRLTLSGETFLL